MPITKDEIDQWYEEMRVLLAEVGLADFVRDPDGLLSWPLRLFGLTQAEKDLVSRAGTLTTLGQQGKFSQWRSGLSG